ncbi:glycosyltransferase family 4 protein [Streptomyces sp. NPDC052225]|uniref:glycosyltransferase family 4 protein n=1 Tax=Streptomyces sp. NPDC052225 TaxID=3154949 RepID=UPI00344829DD
MRPHPAPDPATPPEGGGRRVVMLVDNGVNGDSRVQKAARSMADAGWRVTLLGQSPDRRQRTWMLGEADVRLLPMARQLDRRRHQFRRPWLRRPLAYRPGGIDTYRVAQAKAWRADLLARRAAEGRNFLVRRAAAQALVRWTQLRQRQLTQARAARKNLDGATDRLWAWTVRTLMGVRSWRRLEPYLWDYEFTFGPVIDALRPDLIHANDFRMIGVGARAAARARAKGREVKLLWDAHEYLPGIKPRADHGRWLPAHCAHEREYAPYADAVVTVSETLADLLRRDHGLPRTPAVVLNAPGGEPPVDQAGEPAPDLRAMCGVGPDTPLLVYSGAVAQQRGLDTVVEALPRIPGAHAAFVVLSPQNAFMKGLLARAAELGVADRVHPLPYVPHWQVVDFLSGADVGLIPIHHWPNHELALITKFMEYAHARLPIVVSDVRTMAGKVRETGQGEVFRAEDTDDFVRAVRAVLADPARYRAAYDAPGLLEAWTWQAQAEVLDGVYRRLLPHAVPRPASQLTASSGVN